MTDFPRAARWEAGLLLSQLAQATGVSLSDEGRCRGGAVGASYVRWPDGRRSVLTARPAGQLAEARQSEALISVARLAGIPAPRCELIADLPAATVIVQEFLPGSTPAKLTRDLVKSMAEVTERAAGLLAGQTQFPAARLYLLDDGPGFCLHAPMAAYDRRTARLLAAVEEIGAAVPEALDGDDLAHMDFHPGNVLFSSAGVLSGVVDWDGASRSNNALDLTTLQFDLALRAPELGRWVGGLIRERSTSEVRLACWAHMCLRLVDWMIRELSAADVDAWIEVADELMP